jgi:hypothetical protein
VLCLNSASIDWLFLHAENDCPGSSRNCRIGKLYSDWICSEKFPLTTLQGPLKLNNFRMVPLAGAISLV